MEQNTASNIEEVAANIRREYQREYIRKNPDKKKAWNKAYWEKKAAARLQADGNRIRENA